MAQSRPASHNVAISRAETLTPMKIDKLVANNAEIFQQSECLEANKATFATRNLNSCPADQEDGLLSTR